MPGLRRCAHRISFGKIECCKPHGRHPVLAGVKQPRLLNGHFGSSAREVPGPAFMTDRSDFAIATCANADSLDRRRPVRRVVHQEGAGQGDLHGAPGFAGGERGKHRICSQEQLDSETTAHEGRHDMDFLLVDSERRREIGPPPVDHLARRPDSQVIAIPGGDGGVRLHHRMRLIRGRIDLVELNGRCLEAGIEVARSGGTPSFRLDGAVLCRRQVECALFLGIIDLDQRGGRASLLECFRDHDGDRLVIVLNLHAAEELGRVVFSFLQFPHRFCRYDRDHARAFFAAAVSMDLIRPLAIAEPTT